MKHGVFIQAHREAYSPSEVHGTMTVDELREKLLDYPSDWPVLISNDGGYSYGAIYEGRIDSETFDEEGDESE